MEEHDDDNHTRSGITEAQQQRLHRLVLPLILDLLRSRSRRRSPVQQDLSNDSASTSEPVASASVVEQHEQSDNSGNNDNNEDRWFVPEDSHATSSDSMDVEEQMPPLISTEEQTRGTNQQGQFTDSPSTPSTEATASPDTTRRSRYRLVVYFEDRDAMDTSDADGTSAPTAPSRYVALFSIDSDAHDMPVIHSADFQQSTGSIDDILNQLFAAYCPKGTPPAKKEIIDTLPTVPYISAQSSEPRCAVCLEDFEDGAETVELPCSHRFHGESCVKQWLRLHSSCPVCRYEMPVDDQEYEEKRKARMMSHTSPRNTHSHNHVVDDQVD